MQMNIAKPQGDLILGQQFRAGSHSAPLYAEKFDSAEINREMKTSVQKLNRHVLPTPDDAKSSITSSIPLSSTTVLGGSSKNIWHSSPLDIEKQNRYADEHLSARNFSKSQVSSAEENSGNKHFLPLPRPLTEAPTYSQSDTQSGFDTQKIRRLASFSGPLVSNPSSTKPLVPTSGPISFNEVDRASGVQRPSSVNVSHVAPPPLVSSPKVSELHSLPRPPDYLGSKVMPTAGVLRHSAPLVNRIRQASPTDRNYIVSSKKGTPLPLPHLTVSRSFSIPSSSQRAIVLDSGKPLESSQVVQKTEVPSPPITPISYQT